MQETHQLDKSIPFRYYYLPVPPRLFIIYGEIKETKFLNNIEEAFITWTRLNNFSRN
jgi:hypothetical protein